MRPFPPASLAAGTGGAGFSYSVPALDFLVEDHAVKTLAHVDEFLGEIQMGAADKSN